MITKPIPYGHQHITDEDIQAVVETLKSDYLTQGPKIAEFEHAFADYVGAKYAVAVNNATAGLHLGTIALGVKPGSKVIVTPLTFASSANCVRFCGGDVVFCDIDKDTYLLDIDKVETLLRKAPKGTYQGIIPVDFAGYPVDLEKFHRLADEYGLWIMEDACHAPGIAGETRPRGIVGAPGQGELDKASRHPPHVTTEHILYGCRTDAPVQLVEQEGVVGCLALGQGRVGQLLLPFGIHHDERQAEEYLLRAITAGSCQHALHAVGRQQVVVREKPNQRLARQGDATLPVGHQVAPAQVFRKAVVGDGQLALISTYNGFQRLGTGIVAHIHGEVPARLCRHRVERLAQEAAFIGRYYDGYLVPHVYFSFSLLCVGRKGMA